jgi:hypothetical protein
VAESQIEQSIRGPIGTAAGPEELTLIAYNVRGLGQLKKQQAVAEIIRHQKADIAMLTETKLTKKLKIPGYRG